MKRLLIPLMLVVVGNTYATNYYISSAGNDLNTGKSTASPWRTLAKLNASFGVIVAGDSILLNRGDVFFGSIIISKSGTAAARIVVSAYGTGAKPLVTGFTSLTGWTDLGAGIWQLNMPALKSNANLITLNGRQQIIGRYPNANAANGGYLNYENLNSSATTITDNELTAATNWTGADVVIRKNHWILDICKIDNHSGTLIDYTNPAATENTYPGIVNFGYFIQNDPRTLDQLGEWYLNKATKNIQMFFGATLPSAYTLKASVVDTVINAGASTYITIENIAVEGANRFGIFSFNGNATVIKNCDVSNCGHYGLYVWNVPNTSIVNNTVSDALTTGIFVYNTFVVPTNIIGNTVKNIALKAGMGESGDSRYNGIFVNGNNVNVEQNRVDSIGYNGIQFQGNNILIKRNFVTNTASVKDDGGGIYTYVGSVPTIFTNRVITENIVLSVIGAPYGTENVGSDDGRGIYMDGNTMNVSILNNTVANCIGAAMYLNNTNGIIIKDNIMFNNNAGVSMQRFAANPLVRNTTIKNNVFYPLQQTQKNISYWNASLNQPATMDIQDDMRALGTFDSNYYRNDIEQPFDHYYHLTEGGTFVDPSPMNIAVWKTYMNQDANSKKVAKDIPEYTVTSIVGSNKTTNGQFTSNISNMFFWSPNNGHLAAWDNTSKITGVGSLKVTASTLTSNFTLCYSSVGAVASGKKYLLKFNTLGNGISGIVKAALRKTGAPYNNLVPDQSSPYGTSVTTHEFLFEVGVNETDASFLIQVQQTVGITYIDNIELYEVVATAVNINSEVRFEYNATAVSKSVILDAKYLGVDSVEYNGSIVLQPYSSKVLIKSGALAALIVDAGTNVFVPSNLDSTILTGTATLPTVTYEWTKKSGPPQYTIVTPTNAQTVVDNLIAGTYTFQIKATDQLGRIAIDTVVVTALKGIVPVTLVNFSAQKNQDNTTNIAWVTTAEENSHHYEILKSKDGVNFNKIAAVAATNNTGNLQNVYNFKDLTLDAGKIFYQLKMIDNDGSFKISNTVVVSGKTSKLLQINTVALAASSGKISFNISSASNQHIQFTLVTSNGVQLATKTANLQPGINTITNIFNGILPAVYYLKVSNSTELIAKAVIANK